ncbi:MAG: hypothetical protein COB85_06800 [Bacteroidetes bacterium]|nr:MAG: hypothetical protein COB85_06800 [Bacteroidota bacterium]
MQYGTGFKLHENLYWMRKLLLFFIIYDGIIVILYWYFPTEWLTLPWQPISLIGIMTAFFLGFKNNSSFERSMEARKIWGGIVNTSRSMAVQIRDFVTNEFTATPLSDEELKKVHKKMVLRHVAWLKALTYELRVFRPWENNSADDKKVRIEFGTLHNEEKYDELKDYLSVEDYDYIIQKGNKPSHLLSLQSKQFKELRHAGHIDDFRHMEIQSLITELYALQGKSERIKNYPIPTGYTSVCNYFTWTFTLLVPFGMLHAFEELSKTSYLWLAIPFSLLVSWVFHLARMVGAGYEHPFQGLAGDVPIDSMARGIEIDIRQMLDDSDIPKPLEPVGPWKILY